MGDSRANIMFGRRSRSRSRSRSNIFNKPSSNAAGHVVWDNWYFDAPPLLGNTGQIKTFVGGLFTPKPIKIWNGSTWIIKPLKVWNGSIWLTTSY